MGRKVSDEWTVPLCATHHRALHSVGDEEKWWKERQVDPIALAEQLWRERWYEASQQPSELTSQTFSPELIKRPRRRDRRATSASRQLIACGKK